MTKFYYMPTDESLMHYGVKGQIHGHRRYQNKNGTWTEEGKARRRVGNGSSGRYLGGYVDNYDGVKKAQAKYDKAFKEFDDYRKKNNLFQPDDDGPVYANENDFKKGKIHKKGTELSDKADAAYKELEDIEYGRNNEVSGSSNKPTFKNDIQRKAYEDGSLTPEGRERYRKIKTGVVGFAKTYAKNMRRSAITGAVKGAVGGAATLALGTAALGPMSVGAAAGYIAICASGKALTNAYGGLASNAVWAAYDNSAGKAWVDRVVQGAGKKIKSKISR